MGRIEGSRRRCQIELHVWLKHARAGDEVCFQTDAVGVLEQHRIVTRRPCSLLRALDYGGPNLPKQIMQAIHVFANVGSQAEMVQANPGLYEAVAVMLRTGWLDADRCPRAYAIEQYRRSASSLGLAIACRRRPAPPQINSSA